MSTLTDLQVNKNMLQGAADDLREGEIDSLRMAGPTSIIHLVPGSMVDELQRMIGDLNSGDIDPEDAAEYIEHLIWSMSA